MCDAMLGNATKTYAYDPSHFNQEPQTLHLLMFFLRLISRLPLGVLYVLSDLLFVLAYHVFRYRRNLVRRNLVASFPSTTLREIKAIEKKFYRNLCDFSVESLKLLTMTPEQLTSRVVFRNADELQQYKEQGTSVLLLASHLFNWEWLLAAGCLELPMAVDFVYQPQRSSLANSLSLAMRTRFGGRPVARETVGRDSVRRREIVHATATVADQFPGHFNHRRYWTNFLGQRTAFFHGIAQLAVLMRSPVYYSEIHRTRRGRFEVVLRKVSGIPATEEEALGIIDAYARLSEDLIRRQPENWLWSHNRWKDADAIDRS
jgi:KDO2-lipid IV(A) lauroyltransferase